MVEGAENRFQTGLFLVCSSLRLCPDQVKMRSESIREMSSRRLELGRCPRGEDSLCRGRLLR